MKTIDILFLMGIMLFFTSSCTTEDIHQESQTIVSSFTSRQTSDELSLPEGSQALFNATGGLEFNQKVLTYHNGYWGEGDFPWKENQDNTLLTVIHPVVKDNNYSTSCLYETGELTDVLISKVQIKKKENIQLTFQHLFSQLIIIADKEVQKDLIQLSVTTPQQVSEVNPKEGTFTLSGTSHTTTLSKNENGNYSILVPPAPNSIIHLDITTQQGEFTCDLKPYTFETNHTYTCKLVKKEDKPGIYSAEDLILFSLLINNKEAKGKTLKDFGYTLNGRTIYALQNDIELTDEDNRRLLPICYNQDKPFEDIFEGNNHTISHYKVPYEQPEYKYAYDYGAFVSCIGEKGIVRNLHIRNVFSDTQKSPHYMSVITGVNKGLIDHCSVSQGEITYFKNNSVACISCTSRGTIINCWTDSFCIHLPNRSNKYEVYAGGIACTHYGSIMNCYTKDFSVTFGKNQVGYAGGIAGKSTKHSELTSPSYISNCYSYLTQKSVPEHYGACVGWGRKGTIQDFYTNHNHTIATKESPFTITWYKIDDNYNTSGKPMHGYLNRWIDNNSAKYSNLTFHRWKRLGDGTTVLE